MVEDLRGEREIVNSKSEEEEDENEWDGEGGSVWDLEGLSVRLPIVDCYIICIVLRERKREREREREMDLRAKFGRDSIGTSYNGFER